VAVAVPSDPKLEMAMTEEGELIKRGPPHQVRWIVSEGNESGNGEFGVEVDGVAYFYYKWPDPHPDRGTKYREINKREFGEVIRVMEENRAERMPHPGQTAAPRMPWGVDWGDRD
jgi:hypothetical protein